MARERRAPERVERSASDYELPPISVDADEAASEGTLAPRAVDPYPLNSRCYVAGRYMPAPPICPSL